MKAKFLKSFARRWCAVWLLFCAAFALVACKPESGQQGKDKKFLGLFTRESDMPDNGVRKLKINGTDYHYIPLKEAKFLIPDKTWLKGFSRRATDNSVNTIALHAQPPDFLPWSQERHQQMYSSGMSMGVIEISIVNRAPNAEAFRNPPYGIHPASVKKIKIAQLPDDNEMGLFAFRLVNELDGIKRYSYIKNNRVEYSLRCNVYCSLYLIREKKRYEVEMYFHAKYLRQSVVMADKLQLLLDQFEAEGERYAHLAEMTERGKVGVF